MGISSSSIIIVLLLWYVLLGIYNLGYLFATKRIKEVNWPKFILSVLTLTFLYALASFVTIAFFSSSFALFAIFNTLLLLGVGFIEGFYVLKQRMNEAAIYSVIFVVLFSLLWYKILGLI
ncbi:MAG: hypothetical protein M1355_01120 [Patescibacteria group bacterium]|nr:hypothetical protein [Patescibacteria group bacterium]